MKFIRQRKGFSLLEMLLSVVVVSGLLVVVFELLEDYVEKELAVATADYMENIALAVQDIVEDPTYFQEAYTMARARPSDTLELSLSDLVNGIGAIPGSARLNKMIRDRNPMGVSVSVLLRIADDPSNSSDVQAFDILVATNERIVDERLRRAATAAGGYGGLIREGAASIRNAFASWEIPVNHFSGTTWANTVASIPASIEDGGYLAHYRHMSFGDVTGDYMFRVSVPGRSDLNTMYTNLDMGSNNIMGIDNFELSRDARLRGQVVVDGNVGVTRGTTQINQGNVYAGQRFTAQRAVVIGKGIGEGKTGSLTVDDRINVGNLNLSGQLNAETATMHRDFVTTGQVDVTNAFLGDISNVGGKIQTKALVGAPDTTIDLKSEGKISAAGLRINENLIIESGNVGTESVIATGAVDIGGKLTSPTVSSDDLAVQTFGTCDRGC